MLRCGHCDVICTSYEDWLSHLVSEKHQANLGVSDVLIKYDKDEDRNERSLMLFKMNPKVHPYEVLCSFAQTEPLGFITDAYVHLFSNVNEKFYLIVFDQRKFVDRIVDTFEKCGDQKVLNSMVQCKKKTSFTAAEWKSKLDGSFFCRRHEHLRLQFEDLNWDHQLTKLLSFVSLDAKGYQDREAVMEELESLLHEESEEFQNATVNPFGSCTTWLADKNADLDVFVDATGDGGRTEPEAEKKADIMSKITKILRKKYDGRNVIPIKNARVPIIMFHHPSGLKVDVSFENCLSVQNSKMIRLMTKLDYRVRPFLIFLRYWARYHNLIGPHSIKSYALILMAFVFLRKRQILPSIHELQNVEGTRPFMVCNWNASYCGSRDIVQKHLTWLKCCRDPSSSDGMGHEVMSLCYGFFTEYVSFNFETFVVCPLIGDYLPKKAFESQYGVELPKEMELLKANLVTGQCSSFNTFKPLCIQDPYTLNVNVTASCTNVDIVHQFKTACSQASEALKPFIKTYGLADKECIIELCCQPISQERKQEIIMAAYQLSQNDTDANTDNHDHLAYVKTEATTTTYEDNDHASQNNSGSTNEVIQPLMSIKDFYADQLGHDLDFNKNNSSSRDRVRSRSPSRSSFGRGRGRKENRDERPVQILRTSAFDDNNGGSESRNNSLVDYDLMDHDYEEEKMNQKSMKSVVVVPGKIGSSSPRIKKERSSSPGASPLPKKKNRTEERRESGSVPSPATPSNYKGIVVTVENMKETAVPEIKVEPTVKYIHDTKKPATSVPPPPSSSGKSGEEDVDIAELEAFYQYLKEGSSSNLQITVENNTPTPTSLATDNNYGYKTSPVMPKPKSLSSSIPLTSKESKSKSSQEKIKSESNRQEQTPSSSDNSTEAIPRTYFPKMREAPLSPSGSQQSFPVLSKEALRQGLRFPDFAVFADKTYQETFLSIYSPLKNFTFETKRQKMIQQWVHFVKDFFSENMFWRKIDSIADSFESLKVEDQLEMVFHRVDSEKGKFIEDSRAKLVEEENFSASGQLPLGYPRWYPNPDKGNVLNCEALSTLVTKFNKIPVGPKKHYATVYYFMCHVEVFLDLQKRLMQVSDDILNRVTVHKGPVETFVGICEEIEKKFPKVSGDLVSIKMIVAHDNSDFPGIFIGFQNEEQMDVDPTYEKQVTVQQVLKNVIQDLLPKYVMYRQAKYLHRSK